MRGRALELGLRWLAGGAALGMVLMLAVLLAVLAQAAWPAVRAQGAGFLGRTAWRPGGETLIDAAGHVRRDADGEVLTGPPLFGVLAMVWGTVASSAIALGLAVPVAMGAALFLVRIAPRGVGGVVGFMIEFLAAIPSLAYGLWGFAVLGPALQGTVETWAQHIPGVRALFMVGGRSIAATGQDLLTAGVLLAIMIVPIVTALARDILSAVPRAQVEGTTALGATWWQTGVEMLRFARAGLFGAVMLGLARAAGETIAVTLVIGNVKQVALTPFAPAQTMASLLANEFGEAASSPLHRGALWEVALLLLVMSLAFNVVARGLVVGRDSGSAGAH